MASTRGSSTNRPKASQKANGKSAAASKAKGKSKTAEECDSGSDDTPMTAAEKKRLEALLKKETEREKKQKAAASKLAAEKAKKGMLFLNICSIAIQPLLPAVQKKVQESLEDEGLEDEEVEDEEEVSKSKGKKRAREAKDDYEGSGSDVEEEISEEQDDEPAIGKSHFMGEEPADCAYQAVAFAEKLLRTP